MNTTSVPFYVDWSFWTSVLAAVAILLSQLPPARLWFRRARIDLEIYSRFLLTHRIGNPNIQLHLVLSNSGGKTTKVSSILVRIFRDDKELTTMPAKNFLPTSESKNAVLFTGIVLKPGEEWAHEVNFLNFFSRENEKKAGAAGLKLKEEIVRLRNLPQNKEIIVRADESFVTPLHEVFNECFIWKPGEYKLTAEIRTKDGKADMEKTYRFTLFESDFNQFEKSKEELATGDGVFWETGNYSIVGVNGSEA